MTSLEGVFTVRCGKPRTIKQLVAQAAAILKDEQRRLFITMDWRKVRGPYFDGYDVCFDYRYEPTRRYA